MSKHNFSEKELILLQIILINYDPDYVVARFPIAVDDLKHIIKNLLKKVSEMFINPPDEGIHPLASNKEIFDAYHEKIKRAIESVSSVSMPYSVPEEHVMNLLKIIGELCGKQLI